MKLKTLRIKGNDSLLIGTSQSNIYVLEDLNIYLNARQITQEEADEIFNLIKLDKTLAFIHFMQIWDKYHEIKNI